MPYRLEPEGNDSVTATVPCTGLDVIAYCDRLVSNIGLTCCDNQVRSLVIAIGMVQEARTLGDPHQLVVFGGLGFLDGCLVLLRDRLAEASIDRVLDAPVPYLLADRAGV